MAGPTISNFSCPAGSDFEVDVDIDPDAGHTLAGATLYWQVFEQENGIVTPDVAPIIEKSSPSSGIVIDDDDAQTITITLAPADTVDLLRNYYHELVVVDANSKRTPVAYGMMTVTGTENRGGL